MELNSITALRRSGLIETICFKYSESHGRWSFNNTYKYYVDMTTRCLWRGL